MPSSWQRLRRVAMFASRLRAPWKEVDEVPLHIVYQERTAFRARRPRYAAHGEACDGGHTVRLNGGNAHVDRFSAVRSLFPIGCSTTFERWPPAMPSCSPSLKLVCAKLSTTSSRSGSL